MSGGWEISQQIEQTESSEFNTLQEIQAQYADYGYEEYFKPLFDTLDSDNQLKILQVFQNQAQSEEFQDYIEWNYLPYDDGTLQDFLVKFSTEIKGLWTIDRWIDDVQDELGDKENELNDVQDELDDTLVTFENTSELTEMEQKSIQALASDLENKYWVEIPDDIDGIKQYISENFASLLDQAREDSHTDFVELYDTLQNLQTQGVIDLPWFENFENQYRISQELVLNPESSVWWGTSQVIESVLWESNISDIDGDIIRGENGEMIDMSGTDMVLSLEWVDGLVLEVWAVERIDTRKQEIEVSHLETEKTENESKIQQNEWKIQGLESTISEYESKSDDWYTHESVQDQIAMQFARVRPRTGIVEAVEKWISWEWLKKLVVSFFSEKLWELNIQNTELADRNTEIVSQVWILHAQITSRRREAAEEITAKKEQVRRSQQFLESIWVSRVVASMSEIFPMISEQSPVYLWNGDIITSVNFATMEFKWSFTPSLGEGWANDPRTQEVLTQLINKTLSWSEGWPMEVTWKGNIVYRMDETIVDKAQFDSYIAETTGNTTFEMRARWNLFWNEKSE